MSPPGGPSGSSRSAQLVSPKTACDRCGHSRKAHHWDGKDGGRCCEEVDRYELCTCSKFQGPPSTGPAWKPNDQPSPFFVRAADRLYEHIDRAIAAGRIDARSEIGDAALDYRDIRDEMADSDG